KISSDGCSKKEQMVVSAIASTPHTSTIFVKYMYISVSPHDKHFSFVDDSLRKRAKLSSVAILLSSSK
ncbi:hypothetical protein, partial [Shigella boydii]|uniref:hypothetical protein n=1 Tax=Shigella boydii TaxID=621 RepID=UPI001C0A7522